MADNTLVELPKPDAIVVPKDDVQLTIDFRKKKSGDGAGTYVPFLPKEGVTVEFLRKVVGDAFLVNCAVTRYNSALGDWAEDVLTKEGMFSIESFVKRVLSGKLARVTLAEISEQLEEVHAKLEAITLQIDAAGGTESQAGAQLMAGHMNDVHALHQEMLRLNSLKLAQKRKKKDSDSDDE